MVQCSVPEFTLTVRQFIPTYASAPSIIVIAQQWPCWLSTALSLHLPVVGAYFSSLYHQYFIVPDSLNLMTSWSTLEDLCPLDESLSNCTVLASGSMNFLPKVQHILAAHSGPFIFSADVFFPRVGLRDARRLYQAWACHRLYDGYGSAILSHSDYGGATNGVHYICHRNVNILFGLPAASVQRTVKHFVNAATRGGFKAIKRPPTVPADVAREPLVVYGLGRIDGLYDVAEPSREYAVPSVFKSTGWVQRRLSPSEWLNLHDMPVDLNKSLAEDSTARSVIALALSPLVISSLFHTLWGSVAGGGQLTRGDLSGSAKSNMGGSPQRGLGAESEEMGRTAELGEKEKEKFDLATESILGVSKEKAEKAEKAEQAVTLGLADEENENDQGSVVRVEQSEELDNVEATQVTGAAEAVIETGPQALTDEEVALADSLSIIRHKHDTS